MTKSNRVINDSMTECDPNIKTEVNRWEAPTEWTKIEQQTEAYTYRSGWLGVWDAFVSAITGRGRRVELVPATISFWVKATKPTEYSVSLTQGQLELKGQHE